MWKPLDDSVLRASGGLTTEVVEIGPVPEGLTWELLHAAVEDQTTGFTSVRIGTARANSFNPLEEQLIGVAGELYNNNEPIIVPEGYFLRAQFIGTTSGDKLALYANGRQHPRGG